MSIMKLHVVSSAEYLETDISDCHFISLKPFQIVSNIYAELRIQNKNEASPMRMLWTKLLVGVGVTIWTPPPEIAKVNTNILSLLNQQSPKHL